MPQGKDCIAGLTIGWGNVDNSSVRNRMRNSMLLEVEAGMPITARDIAAAVGISQSTVSRILSGDGRHRVSAVTRARVLETAGRLGYHPNAIARSLRSGRTHCIGLYTTHRYDARNDFLAEILGGLQHACSAHGLDLLLHIGGRTSSADGVFNGLRDGRIDGLLLHTSPDDPLVTRLSGSELPVVAVADPLPQLPSITCADGEGMRLLVDHLWERGHRRFAFVAPEANLASVERRVVAWKSALRRHGVPYGGVVIRIPSEEPLGVLEQLRTDGNEPCAVSCWNDRTAYGLLRACLESGLRVPNEIAVTGFDGFLDDKLPARHLVTIQCPWANAAATAVELLLRHIRGEAVASETCLPVQLVPGDTT